MKTAYLLDFLVFTRFFRVYISIPDDFFPSKTADFALNRNSMQHEMQHENCAKQRWHYYNMPPLFFTMSPAYKTRSSMIKIF